MKHAFYEQKQGKKYGISHYMICKEVVPEPQT